MSGKCGMMKGGRSRSSRKQRQSRRQSHKQRQSRRQRRRQTRRQQRGGTGNAPVTSSLIDNAGSATRFMELNVGSGQQQFANTFQGPTNMYGASIRNLAMDQPTSPADVATLSGKGPFQSGGRRRQIGRKYKGGFLGTVIQDAAVPFGLWAAQNAYGKRTRRQKR